MGAGPPSLLVKTAMLELPAGREPQLTLGRRPSWETQVARARAPPPDEADYLSQY